MIYFFKFTKMFYCMQFLATFIVNVKFLFFFFLYMMELVEYLFIFLQEQFIICFCFILFLVLWLKLFYGVPRFLLYIFFNWICFVGSFFRSHQACRLINSLFIYILPSLKREEKLYSDCWFIYYRVLPFKRLIQYIFHRIL